MGIEFVGGSDELTASGVGKITVSYARDAKIEEILVNSSGRVKITSISQVGVEEYLTGEIELEQLKKEGNTYTLPEPIPYKSGNTMYIGLTDISKDKNVVYITFVVTY